MSTPTSMMHMLKWISSRELAQKIPEETRAYATFYGHQDVLRPPPLEPAAPPLEPAAPDKKMRQSAFNVLHVIILAQALVISFLLWIIWKLM